MITLHTMATIAAFIAIILLNCFVYTDLDIFYDVSDNIDNVTFYISPENDCFYDIDHRKLCFCASLLGPDCRVEASRKKPPTAKLLIPKIEYLKRKSSYTETDYPSKQARSLPFFTIRSLVFKRKASYIDEEPIGGKLKRTKKTPTVKILIPKKEYLKRKLPYTETDYPSKQARSLPFFTIRSLVFKRKASYIDEEPTGVTVKRARRIPAVIQLTWTFFIEEIRRLKMIAKVEQELMKRKLMRRKLIGRKLKAKKRITLANKMKSALLCKNGPLVPQSTLGKRSVSALDTTSSSPKRAKLTWGSL